MTNEQIVKLANAIEDIFCTPDGCEKEALRKECCALRDENEVLKKRVEKYELEDRLRELLAKAQEMTREATRLFYAGKFVDDLTRRS